MKWRSAPPSMQGFTLLEVLVAFVILVSSLLALYQVLGGSSRAMVQAERQGVALILAQTLMAKQNAVPRQGLRENGQHGEGFHWQLRSQPVSLPPRVARQTTLNWPLHLLSVKVSWRSFGRQREVRLETVLPETPPEKAHAGS